MENKKKIIGVTGSLASGKTLVSLEFEVLGAERIDADRIARELLSGDEIIKKNIVEAFGTGIIDQDGINRVRLAEKAFSSAENAKKLSVITHPAIIGRIRRDISLSKAETVVVDAPLLFESGLSKEMDMVVVVSASDEICLKRAVARGLSEELARRIMSFQIPLEDKLRMADHIIVNEGNIENIKEGVKRVWQKK